MGMEDIKPDGDRLGLWKKHKKLLPLLSKVVMQVLGIPYGSAKSERVFSTGGIMVSKDWGHGGCRIFYFSAQGK